MKRSMSAGFTLVELMIVVVIVAILAAVAYPAYTQQMQKTRRGEMQGMMMDLAASLEGWRAQNFSYEGATIADLSPNITNSNHYVVALVLDNNNQSYEIQATPVARQTGDGHMRLDSQGRTCYDKLDDAACDLTDITQRWNK